MKEKFEYTTLAHRYTARFPGSTYVGTQVNFWIIANVFLVVITNLQSKITSEAYHLPLPGSWGPMIGIAVVLGLLYGIILGWTGYLLEKNMFRRLPLGKIILFKTITSVGVLILILLLLRYVFFDSLISPSLNTPTNVMNDAAWRSLFLLLFIYYSVMTLVINFINQINKKYGPGVLLPLLLGRYRNPIEEDRIFMFMDLKSSTTTAEELGHLKYSSFIRDCFTDINEVLYPYRAQVYQYVGDEIVVTWPEREGIKNHFCIRFYFACCAQFQHRKDYYLNHYGLLPHFKAGIHSGTVTTVEIGDIKRDIAHHGDTLNTASRIQGVCNEYGKDFLVSKTLLDKVGLHPGMKSQYIGMKFLKGKTTAVELLSIEMQD